MKEWLKKEMKELNKLQQSHLDIIERMSCTEKERVNLLILCKIKNQLETMNVLNMAALKKETSFKSD